MQRVPVWSLVRELRFPHAMWCSKKKKKSTAIIYRMRDNFSWRVFAEIRCLCTLCCLWNLWRYQIPSPICAIWHLEKLVSEQVKQFLTDSRWGDKIWAQTVAPRATLVTVVCVVSPRFESLIHPAHSLTPVHSGLGSAGTQGTQRTRLLWAHPRLLVFTPLCSLALSPPCALRVQAFPEGWDYPLVVLSLLSSLEGVGFSLVPRALSSGPDLVPKLLAAQMFAGSLTDVLVQAPRRELCPGQAAKS